MKKTLLFAFLAISAAALGQQPGRTGKIPMYFTDTDAAYVLQAISKFSGEPILYNNKNKISITLSITVGSVDEAIQAVSSAASLVFRKVGSIYLVAPKESMKDALAPYTHSETFTLEPGFADSVVKTITDAFPYATVRAIGDKISFVGIPDDIRDADTMIREIVRGLKEQRSAISELVPMHTIAAEDVAALIKGMYPTLEVTATTSKGTAAPVQTDPNAARPVQSFGFLGLRGPELLVRSAIEMIDKLDTASPLEGPYKVIAGVYNLKYKNGPSMVAFLKKEAPEVDCFVGPEDISPTRALFNSIVAQISVAQAGSGGSGSSTSTSSPSSSGGAGGGGATPGGGSATGSSTGVTGKVPGDRAKSIVIKGRQSDVDAAMKLLAALDTKPRQVLIEVKVIETSPTDSEQLGIGYNFSPVNFYDVAPGTMLTNALGAVNQTAGTTQSLAPGSISRTPLNFTATLQAMVSNQTAKLLATPSLEVVDNDQGFIFIGNTISVELTSATSLGGQTQSIAQFPVGIILLISPRISPDGNVTMHIDPVVSTVSSINADGIPQTAAREAETTMIVKDGETTVLGGLIQDQDTKTISQVPFLSQIPIIGQLFRLKTSSHTREDILISITPHIMKETP